MVDGQKNKRTFLIFILLIFFCALLLRLVNLGALSLWTDEPCHLYVAQSMQQNDSFELPSGQPYARAKVYAYLTVLSTMLFGFNEFGIRFPSALFGFFSLVLFFFMTKRLLGNSIATVILLLLAVLPLEIGWARVARFYSLFQFFTMLVWYFFYVGFVEADAPLTKSVTVVKFHPKEIISNWNIKWGYLLLCLVSFTMALSIQQIGIFLVLPIIVYIVLCNVYILSKSKITVLLVSKYFVFLLLSGLSFIVLFFMFSKVRNLIEYGLTYAPEFAKGSSASDRLEYIKFILGKDLFPLGAFFVIGLIQSIIRLNKIVVYSALFFIIQIFLFTFVFSYRLSQYIYNVIPFFILVASYAIVNVMEKENEAFLKIKNYLFVLSSKIFRKPNIVVYIIFVLLLIASPFFIRGALIPLNKPGDSNGAATFLEWKEAAEYLKKTNVDSSVTLAPWPLILKYYYGKVDYNISLSDFAVAKLNQTKDSHDRYVDYYSGIPFITNEVELDSLVKNTSTGYLVVDTYELLNSQYVASEVREYIAKNLEQVYLTPKETVRIFSWNRNDRQSDR